MYLDQVGWRQVWYSSCFSDVTGIYFYKENGICHTPTVYKNKQSNFIYWMSWHLILCLTCMLIRLLVVVHLLEGIWTRSNALFNFRLWHIKSNTSTICIEHECQQIFVTLWLLLHWKTWTWDITVIASHLVYFYVRVKKILLIKVWTRMANLICRHGNYRNRTPGRILGSGERLPLTCAWLVCFFCKSPCTYTGAVTSYPSTVDLDTGPLRRLTPRWRAEHVERRRAWSPMAKEGAVPGDVTSDTDSASCLIQSTPLV